MQEHKDEYEHYMELPKKTDVACYDDVNYTVELVGLKSHALPLAQQLRAIWPTLLHIIACR